MSWTRTYSELDETVQSADQSADLTKDHARPELTRRGRASRQRLVDAALELMLAQGVAATSVDEVLERAGASKSQMYHYFSGKKALVDSVIIAAEAMVLGGQEPFLSAVDSWESLVAWADHVVRLNEAFGPDLGCPLGTLSAELAASDEASRECLERAFERWRGSILSGLRAMRDRGELSPVADPERLATAVIASLQGGLLLAKTAKSIEPIRIALDSALAYVGTFRSV